jgi:signal transduction histidine kinase
MTIVSSKQPAAGDEQSYARWVALGGMLAGCLLNAAVERRAAQALEHERRRVAADVHDLIMQDLSLALANARTLASDVSAMPSASLVVSAGERALAGARVVVNGLTGDSERQSESIVRAIEASAQAAARSTRLIFDANGVPHSARPDRPTREALVHVVREAVTNATKHACPNAIEVTLQYTGLWRLTVRNEGDGFDAKSTGNGFGLTSMRAQVLALGGVLHVSSAANRGTTVEVVLP